MNIIELPLSTEISDIKEIQRIQLQDGTIQTILTLKPDVMLEKSRLNRMQETNKITSYELHKEKNQLILNNYSQADDLIELIKGYNKNLKTTPYVAYSKELIFIRENKHLQTNLETKDDTYATKITDLVLSSSQDKALNEIAEHLATNSPELFLNKKNKIDTAKVFEYIIKMFLNDYNTIGNKNIIEEISNQMSDRLSNQLYNQNVNFIAHSEKNDKNILSLLNKIYVNTNINNKVLSLLFENLKSDSLTDSTILNTIKKIYNNPFENNQDFFHVFSGNENVTKYLQSQINKLFNPSPTTINAVVKSKLNTEEENKSGNKSENNNNSKPESNNGTKPQNNQNNNNQNKSFNNQNNGGNFNNNQNSNNQNKFNNNKSFNKQNNNFNNKQNKPNNQNNQNNQNNKNNQPNKPNSTANNTASNNSSSSSTNPANTLTNEDLSSVKTNNEITNQSKVGNGEYESSLEDIIAV